MLLLKSIRLCRCDRDTFCLRKGSRQKRRELFLCVTTLSEKILMCGTKDIVERKMDRIAKLFPEETTATITLSLEKLVSTVEVTIPLNKRLVRAEVQDGDMTAAIDKAVDILESQVVRYKKRMRTKVRQNSENYMAEYDAILVPETELDEEPLYKIEKIKHFEVKPMDAEEAVMEMELVGHTFFVFRNGETDEVNVVYKRKDGSYGLIEPEY